MAFKKIILRLFICFFTTEIVFDYRMLPLEVLQNVHLKIFFIFISGRKGEGGRDTENSMMGENH